MNAPQLNDTACILLTLSVMLLCGFLVTRLTKLLKLPNVSGFILAGVLIGPSVLGLVPAGFVAGLSFVSDVALAFIAFGVGKFFKAETLRTAGGKTILVTLFESLAAGVLVTAAMVLLFGMSLDFSLVLGAIATATAPASTMMTIRQFQVHGPFVDTLLQVVALDDAACLLVFSLAASLVGSQAGVTAAGLLMPLVWNLAALAVGALCGWVLSKLLNERRSEDNRLILVVAMLVGISGLCAIVDISPLLSCMVLGAVYRNLKRDTAIFRQVNSFTPPIMSLFFIISGMNLDLGALRSFGLVGVGYFLIRIAGKYLGAYAGCTLAKTEPGTRNWLGVALVPQAGVAIGLAFLGRRLLPPDLGNLLLTIILSSSVLYELIGPACAKLALFRSGATVGDPLGRGGR